MATSNNTEILTLCVTHGDKMNFHYILVFEDWSTAVFPEIFLSGYSEKLPLPLMRERRHAPLSTKLFESMYIYIYFHKRYPIYNFFFRECTSANGSSCLICFLNFLRDFADLS